MRVLHVSKNCIVMYNYKIRTQKVLRFCFWDIAKRLQALGFEF